MLVKPYIIYVHVKPPESTTLTQNSHTPSCLFSSPRSLRTHLLCVAFTCHHSCTFHTAEEREENCEGPSPTRFALFDSSIHKCALHFIVIICFHIRRLSLWQHRPNLTTAQFISSIWTNMSSPIYKAQKQAQYNIYCLRKKLSTILILLCSMQPIR